MDSTAKVKVTPIGNGVCRVVHDGQGEIVYVAGPASDRWAFWNGCVFRADLVNTLPGPRPATSARVAHSLAAPMPATVIKVLVEPGSTVKKGDIVVLLEAMKMEVPIRVPGDGVVAAVHCRAGEMVQAGAPLVELG